jgi:hypothetical protein
MTVSSLPARPQLFASSHKLAGIVSVPVSGIATKSSQPGLPPPISRFSGFFPIGEKLIYKQNQKVKL